ncbi:MAG: choline-sulfatase [Gaiellales bacterium]
MTRRPNLLLVMADQLAASALPMYGHPIVQAPHLAGLAARGMVFERAYCASPLCAPSRFAMLTGRPPSAVGAYDNAADLPADTPAVTHVLRAAGYETVLAGKMHFVGPDQLHGFERRLTTDVYPAGFDWTPDWRRPPADRLGWYHTIAGVRDAGVREAALQTDYDDEVCFQAVRELRHLSLPGRERPFFLTVSFTNPHDPWHVRRADWDRYEGVQIDAPKVPAMRRDQLDPHSLRLLDMYGGGIPPLTDQETTVARRAYYAAVSYLDQRVGELLGVLQRTTLAGDTVVVFTADHGELLGERGLWFKMSFLDPSSRVPLVVSGPGIQAGRAAAPVSQLDLAPTLCELAGVAAPLAHFEGAGLAPELHGEQPRPARVVTGEYLAEGVQAPAVMLRRGRHKLIRCPGDPDLLYDLQADPLELENRAGDPACREIRAELSDEADRRWDLPALTRSVLESQERRRLVAAALATGAHTPWDHQPSIDASRQFVRGERAFAPGCDRPYPLSEALTEPDG